MPGTALSTEDTKKGSRQSVPWRSLRSNGGDSMKTTVGKDTNKTDVCEISRLDSGENSDTTDKLQTLRKFQFF